MKAKITKTINPRNLLTVVFLTVVLSMGNAQGLLIEGASNLIHSLLDRQNRSEQYIYNAGYSPESATNTDSFHLRNLSEIFKSENDYAEVDLVSEEYTPSVIKSIIVKNVSVSYETDLATEEWMTEPFSEDLETEISAESWMTSPFATGEEEELVTEEWMTQPISKNLEEDLVGEEWMSVSFYENTEAYQPVENWMTESFSNDFENNLESEEWMKAPFYTALEKEQVVEDWMTEPFLSLDEEEGAVESWMTTLFF